MNTSVSRTRFTALCFAVFFALAVPLFAGEDQSAFLKTMKEQIDEQFRNVRFKATYSFDACVVDTLEKAQEFDTSSGRLLVHASGLLAKNKTMLVQSLKIGELGFDRLYCFDHFTVVSPRLRAYYSALANESPVKVLWIDDRDPGENGLPVVGDVSPIITPLNVAGNQHRLNVLDDCHLNPKEFPAGAVVSVSREKDVTRVSVRGELSDGKSSETIYTLSNAYRYPVLTERRTTLADSESAQVVECLKASDFVRLNGGCVLPRKVCQYERIGNLAPGADQTEKWRVSKWESDDLGKERPKRSDFYIPLDSESDFQSLRSDLIHGLIEEHPKYFKLDRYSPADLMVHEDDFRIPPAELFFIWLRPAAVLAGGLLILFTVLFKLRSFKKGRSAAPREPEPGVPAES